MPHDTFRQALYDEQVEKFSNPDGSLRPMTYEEMKELPVLDGIIRETLRIHSPIHTIMVRKLRDHFSVSYLDTAHGGL